MGIVQGRVGDASALSEKLRFAAPRAKKIKIKRHTKILEEAGPAHFTIHYTPYLLEHDRRGIL